MGRAQPTKPRRASERGAFILAKLEAHDAAKLKDVLVDVYRDAVPDRRT
jgi:hypothetical protein